MTVTLTKPEQLWSTMPGWGIVADLTPPELLASRQLKFLRKLMFSGLALLLVLCAGGYAFALLQHSAADSRLSNQQDATHRLQVQAGKYAGVTQIQANMTQIHGQVAQLMTGDVDLPKLLGSIRSVLPATMTIKQETVTLSGGGATPTTGGAAGAQLDTSGHSRIGTVSLSGTGRTLDDLPRFIDKLKTLPGLVDPVPTSNQVTEGTVSYSLTFGITDQTLSHRFDKTSNGSK